MFWYDADDDGGWMFVLYMVVEFNDDDDDDEDDCISFFSSVMSFSLFEICSSGLILLTLSSYALSSSYNVQWYKKKYKNDIIYIMMRAM